MSNAGDADLDKVGMPESRHLAHVSNPTLSPQSHFTCILSTLFPQATVHILDAGLHCDATI